MGAVELTKNYVEKDGLIDHSVKHRVSKCRRCGHREVVAVPTRLIDPDCPQPLISEATQRLARDPYAGL